MEKTITVTDAARNFADIINRTYYSHATTTLLKSGEPVARIVPVAPAKCLARDLSRYLAEIPHLTKKEASDFERDLAISSGNLATTASKWD